MTIDTDLLFSTELAAAPGICGDDALFAYVRGQTDAEVRVARVRGDAVEVRTVDAFTFESGSVAVSLATRPAVQ